MALLINENCIACDACKDECPTEAIDVGENVYIIDPDKCIECINYYDEPSCLVVCPSDCIVADPDNAESIEELKYKLNKLTMTE